MTRQEGLGFKVTRYTFIGVLTGKTMKMKALDFTPSKLFRGDGCNLLVGTQGEIIKLDKNYSAIGRYVKPFPSTISEGIMIDDIWVGFWVDQEFRHSRMGAFDLTEELLDGESRDKLRNSFTNKYSEIRNPYGHIESVVKPNGALWSRILDNEPLAIGKYNSNLIFSTRTGGIYSIDLEANEIWRAEFPVWPELGEISSENAIIAICGTDEYIYLWSEGGGIAVINPTDGEIISTKIIEINEKISNVIFSKKGGWFIIFHEGEIGQMESIDDELTIFNTGSPVIDAIYDNGAWKWTGWRQDGKLMKGDQSIVSRDDIGVGISGELVITNDGIWDNFRA